MAQIHGASLKAPWAAQLSTLVPSCSDPHPTLFSLPTRILLVPEASRCPRSEPLEALLLLCCNILFLVRPSLSVPHLEPQVPFQQDHPTLFSPLMHERGAGASLSPMWADGTGLQFQVDVSTVL